MKATVTLIPIGSTKPVTVEKKDFLGALETCNPVNNIITIHGRQYQLDSYDSITQDSITYYMGRNVNFYDLNWSKSECAVNDTLTISGKFKIDPLLFIDLAAQFDFNTWGELIFEYYNKTTGVKYLSTDEKRYMFPNQPQINAIPLLGRNTYEFKVLLKVREAGQFTVTPIIRTKGGLNRGASKWITGLGNAEDWTFPITTLLGENIDLKDKGHDSVFVAQWIGGLLSYTGTSPRPYDRPESTITVKVEDFTYRVSGASCQAQITITNNGDSPVRLGEVQLSEIRLLDPNVVSGDTVYPEDILATEGLSVSDNSPLAPGQTRTVEIIMSHLALKEKELLKYNIDNVLGNVYGSPVEYNGLGGYLMTAWLAFFFDEAGNRHIVELNAPCIPSFFLKNDAKNYLDKKLFEMRN